METLRRLMFGGGAVNGGAAPFPDEAQGGGGGGGGSGGGGVAGGAGGGGARGVEAAESGGAAEPGLGPTRHVYTTSEGRVVEIREVWADNLDEEMAVIREVVEQYPYVAMDTEFPGVVARPIGDFMAQDYQYKTLKCNVDLLKIIQLGLSFADEKGRSPDSSQSWQFNFSFSLKDDIYADDSIELLKKSGIDFLKHERHGIDVHHFGELLMTSGLVLLDNVRWISFHSGYDFAYLLKVLTCQALPSDEGQFFEVLRLYFPCFYDIKYLITACQSYHGGLQKIAEDLKVERVGPMHQAGSDSLLTLQTFFKLLEQPPFNGSVSDDKFKCELFGLGHNHTAIRNYNPAMNNYATKMNGGLRESRERADFNAANKDTGATGAIGTPREREATPIQHRESLSVSATGLGSPGLNAVGGPPGNNTNTPPGEELTFLLPEQYSNATQADGAAGTATGDGAAQQGGGS